MSIGKIIAIYIEIGLVLALVEPVLWKISKPIALKDIDELLSSPSKAYRRGAMTGMVMGSIFLWPVHLITWYILDPIIERQKAKKES